MAAWLDEWMAKVVVSVCESWHSGRWTGSNMCVEHDWEVRLLEGPWKRDGPPTGLWKDDGRLVVVGK